MESGRMKPLLPKSFLLSISLLFFQLLLLSGSLVQVIDGAPRFNALLNHRDGEEAERPQFFLERYVRFSDTDETSLQAENPETSPEKAAKNGDDDGIDDDLKSDETTEMTEKIPEQNTEDKDDDDDDDGIKSQADKKLLIILIDGLRHDYIKRDKALKGFQRIAKQGVHAVQVNPVHPANSYPNWYSIVTGLYPENHGFIDNFIHDETTDEIFLMHPHPNASHSHWWLHAEPIWATARKNRIKTAMYEWAGCEVLDVEAKRRPPIVCHPYEPFAKRFEEKEEFRAHLKQIIEDFKDHKYRLAMVYYEGVDYAGHRRGPQSKFTKQAVRDVDEVLYDLQDMIVKNDLDDEVNVYIVSDHGMISTKNIKKIELDDIIDMNDVELVLGQGASVQILAEDGKHEKIFHELQQANIKGLNVYQKSTIPERFHLRENSNLLPIYLTADEGYFIDPPNIDSKVFPDADDNDDGEDDLAYKGIHGYDAAYVDEMDTTMYAFGPDIQDGQVIDEMDQVDHYNVFCHLLGLPSKPNNGSIEILKEILVKFDDSIENTQDEKNDDDEKKDDGKDDDDDDDDDDDNGAISTFSFSKNSFFIFAIMIGTFVLNNRLFQVPICFI